MTNYEIMVETINPCGGADHASRELIEVEADSPEAYIAKYGRFPVLSSARNSSGDLVVTTGDGTGNTVRYTFME